jgi:hypothetical protein
VTAMMVASPCPTGRGGTREAERPSTVLIGGSLSLVGLPADSLDFLILERASHAVPDT